MSQPGGVLDELLDGLHECEGLNPPAPATALARLSRELAEVPERDALLACYKTTTAPMSGLSGAASCLALG